MRKTRNKWIDIFAIIGVFWIDRFLFRAHILDVITSQLSSLKGLPVGVLIALLSVGANVFAIYVLYQLVKLLIRKK